VARLKRTALVVLGWVLVLAGVAALVLPGPGLLLLFSGLAILSQEYEWARRRVEPVKDAAFKAASDGVQTWPRICLSCLGVLWLLGVGVLWMWQPPAPGWWPVADQWWLFGGSATGYTLGFSALVAFGLLVYSARKFRHHPYQPSERKEHERA
jgi:hypothetical protein